MSGRENECQVSQNYILHMKFSEFYLCFHNSYEKCKKECNMLLKLFWYKVLVHSKLKLLNFLVDSVLMIEMSQINVFCHRGYTGLPTVGPV